MLVHDMFFSGNNQCFEKKLSQNDIKSQIKLAKFASIKMVDSDNSRFQS